MLLQSRPQVVRSAVLKFAPPLLNGSMEYVPKRPLLKRRAGASALTQRRSTQPPLAFAEEVVDPESRPRSPSTRPIRCPPSNGVSPPTVGPLLEVAEGFERLAIFATPPRRLLAKQESLESRDRRRLVLSIRNVKSHQYRAMQKPESVTAATPERASVKRPLAGVADVWCWRSLI